MGIEIITAVPTGGGYFKTSDHMQSLAFLVEPKELLEQQPTDYGLKDMIVADITEFVNKGMIDGEEPPIIHTRVRLQGGGIINSLKDQIGKAMVCKLVMKENKKAGFKDYPIFATADPAAVEGVVAYAKKREEDEKAAMEDLPDFLN